MGNFIYNKEHKIYYLHTNGEIYEAYFQNILLAFNNAEGCDREYIKANEKNNGYWIEGIWVNIAELGCWYWVKGKGNNTLIPYRLYYSYSDLMNDKPLFDSYDNEQCYFHYRIELSPKPPVGCFWYPLPFNEQIFNLATWHWDGTKPICRFVKNKSACVLTDQPCLDIINDKWLIDKSVTNYETFDECAFSNCPKVHTFEGEKESGAMKELRINIEKLNIG